MQWNSGDKAASTTAVNADAEMPETKENGEAAVSQENSSDTTQDEVVNEQELKYWKAVKENPADFTSWTYLLQFVEQEVCFKHFYFCSDLDHLEKATVVKFYEQLFYINTFDS